MNSKPCLLTALVVLAAAAIPAQTAHATDDFKFVSPADCVPYQPTTSASELALSIAGIHNPGTSVEAVLCPMPRDQEDPYLSNEVDVSVYFRAAGAPGRVTCTLFIGSSSMQGTAVIATTSSSPVVANGTRAVVTILSGGQNTSFDAVPVSVLCYLDPKISLAGVFFAESGPTNIP